MSNRSIQSRRKSFVKAGLDPDVFDTLMATFAKEILAREPGAQVYLDNPEKLVEVYQTMNEVWQETVYPPDGPKPGPDEIPYGDLYSMPGYLTALFECWYNWTIKSAAATISFMRLHPELQRDCLVLADGFGATSTMLAYAFPNIRVKCHIMGDVSIDLCNGIQHELNLPNLDIITDKVEEVKVPVVLAFECFEHFYEPQAFAGPVLSHCNMLVYSTPWRVDAHGHFKEYLMDGKVLNRSDMPKAFGKWLKQLGFVSSIKTYNFREFNGRPEFLFREIGQLQLPNT